MFMKLPNFKIGLGLLRESCHPLISPLLGYTCIISPYEPAQVDILLGVGYLGKRMLEAKETSLLW